MCVENLLSLEGLLAATSVAARVDAIEQPGEGPVILGLAKRLGDSEDAFRAALEQAVSESLGNESVEVVLGAVAEQIAAHFHLFADSADQTILWFESVRDGPVSRFEHVDVSRLQFDPSSSCPLGHRMPSNTTDHDDDDIFRVSMADNFEEMRVRFTRAVTAYVGLELSERRKFLDGLSRFSPQDTDGFRLLNEYRLESQKLRRCSAQCGFLNYRGSQWYASSSARATFESLLMQADAPGIP